MIVETLAIHSKHTFPLDADSKSVTGRGLKKHTFLGADSKSVTARGANRERSKDMDAEGREKERKTTKTPLLPRPEKG